MLNESFSTVLDYLRLEKRERHCCGVIDLNSIVASQWNYLKSFRIVLLIPRRMLEQIQTSDQTLGFISIW